ncbi:GntR family transcriptional regulator [Brucellaceae bacterium C25G]
MRVSKSQATSSSPLSALTEKVRDDILSGVYRPGEWLRQVDLHETYQATRFQIRRVLDDLVLLGMAEHVPNRGVRLISPSMEYRAELTEVRVCLESDAARHLVSCASEDDIIEIAAAAQRFADACEDRSYNELRQLNHAFHRSFIAPLQNKTMVNLINELREKNLPGFWVGWVSPASLQQSAEDHLLMVDALKARDGDALVEHVIRHLRGWQEKLA